MGEDTLAAWLLAPADPASVRARQEAVQALTPDLDLREDLAILGEEVAATVRRDTLATLAAPARPPAIGPSPWRGRPLRGDALGLRVVGGGLGAADPGARRAGHPGRRRLEAAGSRAGRRQGGGRARSGPRAGGRGARAVRARAARQPAARPAPRGPRHRRAAALADGASAASLGGPARFPSEPVLRAFRAADHVGRALRPGDRGLAGPSRRLRRGVARRRRAPRGPVLAGGLCVGAPGRRLSHRRRGRGALRGRGARAPPHLRGALRAQRRGARRRHASPDRQRLQHVGQEHAAAFRGRQCRAGAGGRAGAGVPAPPLAACPWAPRCASRIRCRRAPLASTRSSSGCATSSASPRGRSRCCSCSTRSSTGPTRTIGASGRPPSCAAWCSGAPSASSPPTTWPCRRSRTTPASTPSTCTSRTGSRRGRWCSTTGCAPAWSGRRTRWP